MLDFWKSWDKESKVIYLGCLILFCASVGWYFFAYLMGENLALQWVTADQTEKISLVIDTFSKGIFDFPIQAENYIVFREFQGSDFAILPWSAWVTFIFTILALITILTTLSFLNNWLYYAGTAVVLVYFIFQQPDVVFDNLQYTRWIQICPVIFLGGTSYVFFAIRTNTKFITRFLIFLASATLYYGLIFAYSPVVSPEIYLVNYGAQVAIILSLVFIFFISFEIVYAFLYIIGNNKSSGGNNGALHFTIIFFLYVCNMVLQYLHNSRQINFELFYISPFIILAISAILGIWGFKERSQMFPSLLPFYPFGAVIYVCWGILAFLTISHAHFSGNDPIIEVFEDAILFSHIGFGIGFFMYIMLNYKNWIGSNVKVNKLIYSYRWVSFLSVYGTGILIVLTFFFYSNMFAYKQYWAGYYNGVADAYLINGEEILAEEYFKEASGYEFQNHKTNYSLAGIYKNRGKDADAVLYYRKSVLKKPSPQAYVNLANFEYRGGKSFEAIYALKEGLEIFRSSGQMANNIGLIYERMNFADSANYYFAQAANQLSNSNVAINNQVALLAKNNFDEAIVQTKLTSSNDMPSAINLMAYNNVKKLPVDIPFDKNILKDSVLSAMCMAYLTNSSISRLRNHDSLMITAIDFFMKPDTNLSYKSDLEYLKSVINYYNGKPLAASRAVDNLQLSSEYAAGNYLNTLGLWALKSDLPRFAADIFQMATDKGNKLSLFNKGVALAEAGMWEDAFIILNSPQIRENKDLLPALDKLNKVFSYGIDNSALLMADDPAKYLVLHYQMQRLGDEKIGNIFFSLHDPYLIFRAGQDIFNFYYRWNVMAHCAEILQELKKANVSNTEKELNLMMIKYFIKTRDFNELSSSVTLPLLPDNEPYRNFAKAVIADSKENKDEAARLFLIASTQLPYDEEVMLTCAGFFQERAGNSAQAFNILLDAVTINPYSTRLYKAYCIQSIKYGIPGFADNGLKKLKTMLSPQAYEAFATEVEREKAELYKGL